MLGQTIPEVLKSHYETKQRANALYSLRAFARDLRISSSQLSMILSGKRGISSESAVTIADSLQFNSLQKKYFLNLAEKSFARSHTAKVRGEQAIEKMNHLEAGLNLSKDEFAAISEWYHLAILQVMQLQGYAEQASLAGEVSFLACRLNLSEVLVTEALVRLRKLGAIRLADESVGVVASAHVPTSDFFMVQGAVPNSAIKSFHRQVIQKAIEAIEFQNSATSAFKTTFLSIDARDFSRLNEELGIFCKDLMVKYGKTRNSRILPNQVYTLAMQFFKTAEIKIKREKTDV
jgi:uncharacterized protein (TIGR02147 family)